MPKLTIRYLIDDAQVDEEEHDEPTEADLRELIEASKYGVSEGVSNLAYARNSGPTLLESLQKIKARGDRVAVDMNDLGELHRLRAEAEERKRQQGDS